MILYFKDDDSYNEKKIRMKIIDKVLWVFMAK